MCWATAPQLGEDMSSLHARTTFNTVAPRIYARAQGDGPWTHSAKLGLRVNEPCGRVDTSINVRRMQYERLDTQRGGGTRRPSRPAQADAPAAKRRLADKYTKVWHCDAVKFIPQYNSRRTLFTPDRVSSQTRWIRWTWCDPRPARPHMDAKAALVHLGRTN